MRRPNPYESKTEYINREFINKLIKPERQYSRPTVTSDAQDMVAIDTLLGDDATVDTVKPYEVVKFHGSAFIPASSASSPEILLAKGYHYTEPDKYSIIWGIAQDFITKTNAAKVLISGISWLNTEPLTLPTPNEFLQYIELFNTSLRFCFNGRGTIINQPQKPHSMVHLSQRVQPLLGKTKSTGLTSGAVGSAFLKESSSLYSFTTSTREIPCFTDLGNIGGNKDLLLFPTNGIWYAVGLCP